MSNQFLSDSHGDQVVVHRQFSPNYGLLDDEVHYPVNHRQLREMLGQILTHLDAMGLPDRAHRAARSLLTQDVWRWWDSVAENATTSYRGCIAPIVTRGGTPKDSAEQVAPSNRWGWESEDSYLASRQPVTADSNA